MLLQQPLMSFWSHCDLTGYTDNHLAYRVIPNLHTRGRYIFQKGALITPLLDHVFLPKNCYFRSLIHYNNQLIQTLQGIHKEFIFLADFRFYYQFKKHVFHYSRDFRGTIFIFIVKWWGGGNCLQTIRCTI